MPRARILREEPLADDRGSDRGGEPHPHGMRLCFLDPQPRAERLDAAAADGNLTTVLIGHDQHVGAAEVGLQLQDMIQVHQEAAVYAQEPVGLQRPVSSVSELRTWYS